MAANHAMIKGILEALNATYWGVGLVLTPNEKYYPTTTD